MDLHALTRLASSSRLLAQDDSGSPSFAFWIIVVAIMLGLAAVAVAIVRRRMDPDEDFRGEGFSLADLRELHKSGQLSAEEFERARAKMVESLHAAQARQAAVKAELAKQRHMT
jgi:hypothetical protein